MELTLENEWQLDSDIKQSALDYESLIAADVAAGFLDTKRTVRDAALELLRSTDYLRDISVEAALSRSETLVALRMLCLPPMTKDRLSGLSGVPVKRVSSIEAGDRPLRPTGRAKLLQIEIPAIVDSVRERLDGTLAPWLAEGRDPRDAEVERLLDVVSDRAAVMSDAYNVPKASLGRKLEEDVEKWLQDSGYRHCGALADADGFSAPAGAYERYVWSAPKVDKLRLRADFAISPKDGAPPVFLDLRISSNVVYALRNRMETDEAARCVAEAFGGRYVLVLCGQFDMAYVRYQLEQGKHVIWHHNLDALRDLGL